MILNSPTISGSLTVTGNTILSGSITSLAGIAGTASYATNADLLDGVHLSTLATTGSNTFLSNQTISGSLTVGNSGVNELQVLASGVKIGNVIGDAHTITGSLGLSGSLTSTGTITAQTLVVQTITSSVDFVTGSAKFGSIISNTHQFTGSVLVSGSQTINGYLNTRVTSSYNAAFYNTTTDALAAITIQSSNSSTSGVNSGSAAIELVGNADNTVHGRHAWIGAEGVIGSTFRTRLKFKLRGESNTGYTWATANAEAPTIMTLDGNGYVGIGRNTPEFTLDVNGDIAFNRTNKLMFAGPTAGDRSRSYITGDGNNNIFIYGPSSNLIATFAYTGYTSLSGYLDIQGNNTIGSANDKFAMGVNSTSYAWIQSFGGRSLILQGAGNNVGIGVTSPQSQLHINGDLTFTESGFDTVRKHQIAHSHSDGNSANNNLRFLVSDGSGTTAERMRINGAGNVGIGATSLGFKFAVAESGSMITGGNAITTSNIKGIMVENITNGDESVGIWFRTGGNHTSGISGQRDDNVAGWGTDLRFYTHERTTVDLSTTRERMRINPSGNVGIGTTTPGNAKLYVNGNIRLGSQTSSTVRSFYATQAGNNITFDVFRWLDDSGTVIGTGAICGVLYLTFSDSSTGGNQIQYEYGIQSGGNGIGDATLTQVRFKLRGTQPITSVQIVNDGGTGGIKVQGTVVSSGVPGCNVWGTFIGNVIG